MYTKMPKPEAVIRYCCKASSESHFIAYGDITEGIMSAVRIPDWCPL